MYREREIHIYVFHPLFSFSLSLYGFTHHNHEQLHVRNLQESRWFPSKASTLQAPRWSTLSWRSRKFGGFWEQLQYVWRVSTPHTLERARAHAQTHMHTHTLCTKLTGSEEHCPQRKEVGDKTHGLEVHVEQRCLCGASLQSESGRDDCACAQLEPTSAHGAGCRLGRRPKILGRQMQSETCW